MSKREHIDVLVGQIEDHDAAIGGRVPTVYEQSEREYLTQELWKAVREVCLPVVQV